MGVEDGIGAQRYHFAFCVLLLSILQEIYLPGQVLLQIEAIDLGAENQLYPLILINPHIAVLDGKLSVDRA